MATPEEILERESGKAQSTTADGVSVTRRSLKELSDLADRQANKEAVSNINDFLGASRRKLVPPGAR